jgi:hypothetical protein
MAPPKGKTNNPNGRPAGKPNKSTMEFREAVNALLRYAAPNMVKWLEKIAADDPNKALDHVHKLAEYAQPKLARTEVTGKDGGAISVQITDNV